jgi:hypothetical protein
MRIAASERAERSTKELMFAYSAHLQWQRRPLALRGRLRQRIRLLGSPAHLSLPHFAAVCEEFSHGLLVECSEPIVPQTHPLLEKLWSLAEAKADTWHGQEEAWSEWHGIVVAKQQKYKNLRPLIEARNAVVHGLGELTRRQIRKDGGMAVKSQLASVGILTRGREIVISDAAMKACVDAARDFITWLDHETQSRGIRPTA